MHKPGNGSDTSHLQFAPTLNHSRSSHTHPSHHPPLHSAKLSTTAVTPVCQLPATLNHSVS